MRAIRIGNQTWMTENLNISNFRNNDLIPEAKTKDEWGYAWEYEKPAWCYYNNDPDNGVKFGKLYNWYAINDFRGLAPYGWDIPYEEDFLILQDYLGDDEIACNKIKSTLFWENENNANNKSGFSALPAGGRSCSNDYAFVSLGESANFWSLMEFSGYISWSSFMDTGRIRNNQTNNFYSKAFGFSVRCIKR